MDKKYSILILMMILHLCIFAHLPSFSQDKPSASLLFNISDGKTQNNIISVDSIRFLSKLEKIVVIKPRVNLNYRLEDLKPTETSASLTVFLQGYEPAGIKFNNLKTGKTKRFSLVMRPIADKTTDQSVLYREDPSFPGGDNKLNCFYNDNLIYTNISDTTRHLFRISFIVDSQGNLQDVTFENPHENDTLNRQLEAFIKRMPKWEPAVLNRNPIAKRKSILIEVPFKIQPCK